MIFPFKELQQQTAPGKRCNPARSKLTREMNTKMEIKLKIVMMLRQQTSGQLGFSG